MVAVSAWLRVLGRPQRRLLLGTWAILGQASGAYVGPTCWAVLFLSAAAAVLHQRAVVAPVHSMGGIELTPVRRLQRLLGLAHERRRAAVREAADRFG